jgi:hypothetical protein
MPTLTSWRAPAGVLSQTEQFPNDRSIHLGDGVGAALEGQLRSLRCVRPVILLPLRPLWSATGASGPLLSFSRASYFSQYTSPPVILCLNRAAGAAGCCCSPGPFVVGRRGPRPRRASLRHESSEPAPRRTHVPRFGSSSMPKLKISGLIHKRSINSGLNLRQR